MITILSIFGSLASIIGVILCIIIYDKTCKPKFKIICREEKQYGEYIKCWYCENIGKISITSIGICFGKQCVTNLSFYQTSPQQLCFTRAMNVFLRDNQFDYHKYLTWVNEDYYISITYKEPICPMVKRHIRYSFYELSSELHNVLKQDKEKKKKHNYKKSKENECK